MNSHHDGNAAGMVAGCRVLLLEAGFVFFVDDDQAEPLERQQDG